MKKRLRVTLVYEYEVEPAYYGSVGDDPLLMALRDLADDPTVILDADWKIERSVFAGPGRTKGEVMTMMRAVARHEVGADKPQIKRELLSGLEQCVYELLEVGADVDAIDAAVEGGLIDYESDYAGRGGLKDGASEQPPTV